MSEWTLCSRLRRRKKLLDDLKDRIGYSHLKEEVLDRTMWRNRFEGSFGPVVRQNTEWMNYYYYYYYLAMNFMYNIIHCSLHLKQWNVRSSGMLRSADWQSS